MADIFCTFPVYFFSFTKRYFVTFVHIIFDFVAFNSSGNDFHSFTNIYPQGNGFMQLGLVSIASQLLLSDSLLFRFNNLAIFTGKHLCLFYVAGQQAFIKKRHQRRYFLVNIPKFLRTPTLRNIFERLLLNSEKLKASTTLPCINILSPLIRNVFLRMAITV